MTSIHVVDDTAAGLTELARASHMTVAEFLRTLALHSRAAMTAAWYPDAPTPVQQTRDGPAGAAATPLLAVTPSGRHSPSRFNDDIMNLLEEARKAFQVADDEALRLLTYLEPTPARPASQRATPSKAR